MLNRKIFLKNIFLRTKKLIIEENTDDLCLKTLNNDNNDFNFDEYIENLDSTYFSLEDWKKSTNLACWNCCLKFEGVPWFIPLSWTTKIEVCNETKYKIIHNFPDGINKQEKKLIKSFGNFCHIRCAIRFLKETSEIEESNKKNYLSLIYLLYYEFTGKKLYHIEPALPKHKMIKYCGESGLTEEQYKKTLEQI